MMIWGDVVESLVGLPDDSVDLVILDPPYWKIADAEWDKQWSYFHQYAEWVGQWLPEVVRVMKRAGSLYLFGYPRNVLPIFHLFEKYPVKFRQMVTWDKGVASLAGRSTKNHQMFSTTTEHIFFWQGDARPWIKGILRARQREMGLTGTEVARRLGLATNGGGPWSLWSGENNFATLPSAAMWPKVQEVLDLHHIAHTDFHPVFNITKGVTDVWSISNRVPRGQRFHPAQKPESVIERIVMASTHPGMMVLDPFAGSATTGVVCRRLGRDFIGIEKDEALRPRVEQRLAEALAGVV